jgi:hypothetical protein
MKMIRGFLRSILLVLVLTSISLIPAAGSQAAQNAFSKTEYRWAVDWINGPLETLMAHGIIESISNVNNSFQVRAGSAWAQLSFRQAGELLSNLSRARQITGHTPFLTLEGDAGIVLGRVTGDSITVLVPGEGYIEYFPATRTLENTTY